MNKDIDIDMLQNAFKKLEGEINFILNFMANNRTSYQKELASFNKDIIPFNSNSYIDIVSQKTVHFNLVDKNKDEYLLFIKDNLNKQFCWHLVDAYESFSIYLDEIYSLTAYFNIDKWRKGKHKDKSLKEVRELVHNGHTRKTPIKNQLKDLRQDNEFLKEYEFKNIDYLYRVTLIEQLRNKIVHQNCIVLDKEDFQNKILRTYDEIKKENVNEKIEKEQPRGDYMNDFDSCFGTGSYENKICLTDIQNGVNISYRSEELIYNLICYGRLIFQSLCKEHYVKKFCIKK